MPPAQHSNVYHIVLCHGWQRDESEHENVLQSDAVLDHYFTFVSVVNVNCTG